MRGSKPVGLADRELLVAPAHATKSHVWAHFRVYKDGAHEGYAACTLCLKWESAASTSAMGRHLSKEHQINAPS
jgi:hypothetical protein